MFGAWQAYYYGDRLNVMCSQANGKTLQELDTLLDQYGFNSRIVKFKDKKTPNLWHISIRPSLVAACSIQHNEKNVISTEFFWD